MNIRRTLALTLPLLSVGFTAPAVAHDLNFKTLGFNTGASATDVWEVGCLNSATLGDSERLVAQIKDLVNNDTNLLSILIYKNGKAISATDNIGGDAGYSPLVSLNGGNGTYTMMVTRSQASFQAYSITYHCESAAGDHTPTTVPTTPVQDQ